MMRDDIVLGIAAYGRSFELASASDNSLYDEILGDGPISVNTGMQGVLSYYEVCHYCSGYSSLCSMYMFIYIRKF